MHVDAVAGAGVLICHVVREPGLARLLSAIEDIAQSVVEDSVELVRLNRLDRALQCFLRRYRGLTTKSPVMVAGA